MTIILTREIIVVYCLCIVVAFLFGLVAGINIEYHTSKRNMESQLKREAERLREIAELACLSLTLEEQS